MRQHIGLPSADRRDDTYIPRHADQAVHDQLTQEQQVRNKKALGLLVAGAAGVIVAWVGAEITTDPTPVHFNDTVHLQLDTPVNEPITMVTDSRPAGRP